MRERAAGVASAYALETVYVDEEYAAVQIAAAIRDLPVSEK